MLEVVTRFTRGAATGCRVEDGVLPEAIGTARENLRSAAWHAPCSGCPHHDSGVNPMTRPFAASLLALCAAGSVPLARAQAITPREDVQRAAEQLLIERVTGAAPGAKLFVSAGALDARLRLPACSQPIEAFLPAGAQPAARTTVGVRCASPNWAVYVPVSVESEVQALVLKRALPRLSPVETADVEVQARRVPGFPSSYLRDASSLAGHHLRLAAGPGTALTVDLLSPDAVIRRGQRVTLLSRAGGIEVAAAGEAMGDAAADGRVRVQNLGSRKVVEGVAESADRVRVGP